MSAPDDAPSLRSRLVSEWKAELFSADTVVALVATAVALPAGLLATLALDPEVLFPVWLATASAPSLGYWGGRRIEVGYRSAARIGAGMATAVAVVTAGTFAVADPVADDALPLVVSGLVGILFGGLVSRAAFARLDGDE